MTSALPPASARNPACVVISVRPLCAWSRLPVRCPSPSVSCASACLRSSLSAPREHGPGCLSATPLHLVCAPPSFSDFPLPQTVSPLAILLPLPPSLCVQVSFVSMAFGSKKKYSGQDMFKAHEKMIREQGLGLEHFDAVAGHLAAAMEQLQVPANLIEEARDIVMSVRPVFDPEQNGTAPPQSESADTLYSRIGGAPAVQATVVVFYKRVLSDPLLAPFFQGVNMEKQQAKQVGNCGGRAVGLASRMGAPSAEAQIAGAILSNLQEPSWAMPDLSGWRVLIL